MYEYLIFVAKAMLIILNNMRRFSHCAVVHRRFTCSVFQNPQIVNFCASY